MNIAPQSDTAVSEGHSADAQPNLVANKQDVNVINQDFQTEISADQSSSVSENLNPILIALFAQNTLSHNADLSAGVSEVSVSDAALKINFDIQNVPGSLPQNMATKFSDHPHMNVPDTPLPDPILNAKGVSAMLDQVINPAARDITDIQPVYDTSVLGNVRVSDIQLLLIPKYIQLAFHTA